MAAGIRDELRWLAHVLSGEPNPLRRSVDRWAAGITACLLVVAAAMLPLAAVVGHGVHQRMLTAVAEQADTHQQVVAVVLEPARPRVLPGAHPQVQVRFEAPARWSDESGASHTGPIAVGADAQPGWRVPIWIGEDGRPAPPPLTEARALSSAISTGVLVVIGGATLCAVAAVAVRLVAEAIGSSAWAREWDDGGWSDRGPAGAG